MLRNKLMTACSVAVLTAALYGCSSSSDDGANMQVQNLQDQIAALNAELGEGGGAYTRGPRSAYCKRRLTRKPLWRMR